MLAVLLAVVTATAEPPQALADSGDEATAREAIAVLEDLLAGRYADVERRFDPTMQAASPPGALARTWAGLRQRLGDDVGRGDPIVTHARGLAVADVPAEFAAGHVRVRFAFDARGRLAGLRILPPAPTGPTAPVPQPPGPPTYAPSGTYVEREVTTGARGWPLPATLTLPVGKGRVPAVVLVHGSGALDRDETIGGVKPFRDLAAGLASRGVAVLRYEKRTKVHAARLASEASLATLDGEIVDDAVAAVELLAGLPEIDPRRIVVAGHSLGAMVLPRVAARTGRVAGLAGLATGARPLDQLVRDQLEHLAALPGGDGVPRERLTAELDRIRPAIAENPLPGGLLLGAPASWWKEALALDPPAEYARTTLPLLFMQGGRDYQVGPGELAAFERALRGRANLTFRRYPRLNHLFVPGDGASSPAEYTTPAHVAPEVVEDLAAFVLGVAPRGP